jgi:hypothetical protein
MNLKKYKPKKHGSSDKYSWNLYKAMERYKNHEIRVFKMGWCPIHGKTSIDKGSIYIVFGGDVFPICGDILRICSSGQKAIGAVMSFSGYPFNLIDKQDITEKFFIEYERIGRCLFLNGCWSHDFIKINKNSRKCRHCGVHQKRTIKSKKIIKRIESWS